MRANSIEELGNYYEMTGFQLVHLDIGQNKLIRLDKQALQNSLREVSLKKYPIGNFFIIFFQDFVLVPIR